MYSSDVIIEYLHSKFGQDHRLTKGGEEFLAHSPFVEGDDKYHLSVNTSSGLWRCFKSSEKGNFAQLISKLDNISYRRAEQNLIFRSLNTKSYNPRSSKLQKVIEDFTFPKVDYIPPEPTDQLEARAIRYLEDRKLPRGEFYVCRDPKFKDRLIIPFKHSDTLYYFQARDLFGRSPKYLTCGASRKGILYPFNMRADHVIVVEGPIDAITLRMHGFNATATLGCDPSKEQVENLKTFSGRIIISYDNDLPGQRGVAKLYNQLKNFNAHHRAFICLPDAKYKDWNEMHVADENLRPYIESHTERYDWAYQMSRALEGQIEVSGLFRQKY